MSAPDALTDDDYDDLSLTETVIVELLAARHRLGEQIWTLPERRGLRKRLACLADAGWIGYKSGVIEHTWLAWLTDAGRAVLLSSTYRGPTLVHDTGSI